MSEVKLASMPDDDRLDIALAIAAVGAPAHPGRVRILTHGASATLQQQWSGPFGEAWIDVRKIPVDPDRPQSLANQWEA